MDIGLDGEGTNLAGINRSIGRRVRACRRAAELSQPQLAERMGISARQLQNYESGLSPMTPARLLVAARALDITPDYLLTGAVAVTAGEDITIATARGGTTIERMAALTRCLAA